jgi:predicted DNA-binding ribbon-helix-helix protein
LRKRSLILAGHKTSLALESEFWEALEAMAADRDQPLTNVIREIDEAREGDNLTSAVRVAVLAWARRR